MKLVDIPFSYLNSFLSLAQLLDSACKVLPVVVAISGRVGSDTPINCEYSGLRGVIVEETVHGLVLLMLLKLFFLYLLIVLCNFTVVLSGRATLFETQ